MTGVSAYSFGFVEIVLLFAVLQTLLLALVLSAGPEKTPGPNRLLIACLASLALILMEFVLIRGKVTPSHPHLLGISLPAYFVLAPLYYLYTRTLPGRSLRRGDALHLLPVLAGMLVTVPFYLLPADRKLALLQQLTGEGFTVFPLMANFLMSLICFQMMIYFYNAYDLLQDYEAGMKEEFADAGILAVGWLKTLSMGFCLFVVIFYLAAAELFLLYPYRQFMLSPDVFSLGIAGFIFLLSWHMYRHPELFALYTPGTLPPADQVGRKTKYEKTMLAPEVIDAYAQRLKDFMAKEKPYLDGELRLSGLAGGLDMPAHHLSQVINVARDRSFFDFINGYRVNHAKALLTDPEGPGNILEIALASGFNSKASFNRVFRKETGTTPTAYQKRRNEVKIEEKTGEYLAR